MLAKGYSQIQWINSIKNEIRLLYYVNNYLKAIKKMISEYHATRESILEDYTEEEYSLALNELAEEKNN